MTANQPRTLKPGDPAPGILLETDGGESLRLADLQGQHVVLFFYPKADTPGCTTEACEFRDASARFASSGAVILGVSPDGVVAQSRFKGKFGLGFTLLADVRREAAEAFGVWKEKSMYGRKYMGVERTTFLLGQDGRIARIFPKVKPAGHAAEVLEALASLP
jgi:peroxiredoxin Q/BCP